MIYLPPKMKNDGLKDASTADVWNSVSATESVVPFIAEIFPDRAVLA